MYPAYRELTVIEQNELMRDKEISPITHNTFAIEEALMNIISRGDTLALQAWLNTAHTSLIRKQPL